MAAEKEKVDSFSTHQISRDVKALIENTTDENDILSFVEHFKAIQASDSEKRLSSDQAFREYLREKLISQKDISHCEMLVQIAINCSKQGVTSVILPVLLISDIFDCSTLDICEKLFYIVEKHVSTWTSELFRTQAISNSLLRMCNDLLRRLSTSQNTIFCGRIQLILTRLFSLSEKSGLNLMSKFNEENVTAYEYKGNINQEISDLNGGENKSEIVDYILYTKFWALQDFFRSPSQCYEEIPWKRFVDNASEVLKVFASHKIEHVSKKRKHRNTRDVVMSDGLQQQTYFAKFLTSEKLLNLQLNDSNFRRTILVQLLILFQYLSGDVKFKTTNQVLKEKQSTFVKETTAKVYELLKETPPDGEKFAKYVECVLTREENWISWKNVGCPSFIKDSEETKEPTGEPVKKSAKHDISRASSPEKIDMGSPELTRLWNLCSDNMTACRSQRVFLPDLKDFFEEAVEQADPAAQIEEQYKKVNDPKFGWRALRLLSRRSQHFFQPSSNPFKTLPQYLDTAVKQLAVEFLPLRTEEPIVENGTGPKIKEDVEQSGTTEQS